MQLRKNWIEDHLKENNTHSWVVYLVRCQDDTLYCGITNNLKKRIVVHNTGKGSKYTRSRLPVVLLVVSNYMSLSSALKLEYQVKQQRKDLKIDYLRQYCG